MDLFKLHGLQVGRASGRGPYYALSLIIFFTVALFGSFGCNRASEEPGKYPITYRMDSLPSLTLTDQYDHRLSLASLRGKPVLFDFIYTRCPGPCQLLTQHMKLIADKLGSALGPRVSFVSVTIDPEHDSPNRLLDYAQAFNANLNGWHFVTGSPAQINELMRGFRLTRERESDGEIDHVLGYFLVGSDGRPTVEYSQRVEPSIAARDVEEAATRSTLIGRLGSDWRHWI
jgi:protein SCO1/2